MKGLKSITIKSGTAKVSSQAVIFCFRIISMLVIARLLSPHEFGIVGMVTSLTGVLNIFMDLGLSSASIQRSDITPHQTSNLFWVNLAAGTVISGIVIGLAPAIGSFYNEPRLVLITTVAALGFFISGAGVQHLALLQREMRFTSIAAIDVSAIVISNSIAIGLAVGGYGYWALVSIIVMFPLCTTITAWVVSGWVPGVPRKDGDIRGFISFGGTMTLTGLVVYIANNIDKILLGRYWGAEAIGLYGRAFQLISIPIDNLNSSVGQVAFAALSRIQDDVPRLKRYFLKGYSIVVALTIPIGAVFALFADDLIVILLGPRWVDASEIFRLLAPTIIVLSVINPIGWLVSSLGRVDRPLKSAIFFAPFVIMAVVIGLPYGPRGVAIGYTIAVVIKLVPNCIWLLRGTPIRFRDIMSVISAPILATMLSGIISIVVKANYLPGGSIGVNLVLETGIFGIFYIALLMVFSENRMMYIELIRELTLGKKSDNKLVTPT